MARKNFAILISLSLFLSDVPAAIGADGAPVFKEQPITSVLAGHRPQSAPAAGYLLKGSVTSIGSPPLLLDGVTQELPPGTKVDLTLMCNLNSEVSQTGDEVHARV